MPPGDVVGDEGATLAHRPHRAGSGVVLGLQLELGVELGPDQDDEGADVEPHQRGDDSAERAIGTS